MRLFIMKPEVTREELGEWLQTCCSGYYGLTYLSAFQCFQVTVVDEEDASTFRLAFGERVEVFGTI